MRAKDSDIFAVGSPLSGEAVPISNGIPVDVLPGSSPSGGVVDGDAALSVAILFARKKTVYRDLPGCDVYDIDRDARNYAGLLPVVAHPPCRGWGKLSHFAKCRPGEKKLAAFAVGQVRKCGGVLEHPAYSRLWDEIELALPAPGDVDKFGGFTLPIHQSWFGHRGHKATWLYIVGVSPGSLPPMPFRLVSDDVVPVESMGRAERERTPA